MGPFIIYEATFFIPYDSFVVESIPPDKYKHSSFILTSASVMCFASFKPIYIYAFGHCASFVPYDIWQSIPLFMLFIC